MMELFQNLPDGVFLGVDWMTWLGVLLLWIGFSAGLISLRKLIGWRLTRFAERTRTDIDDILGELLAITNLLFLVIVGLFLAVWAVGLPEDIVEPVGALAFVAFLVQFVRWGNRAITVWIEKYRDRRLEEDAAAVTSMQAVGFVSRLLLFTAVVLVGLDNFGVEVTALVAGLGVGGIAVALALQNILGDLFSSLSIVLDKPFVVGDFLIVGEHLGTVERIGLKTTRIRSLSGEQIIFSNSDLLKSRIRNYKRMFERRVVFKVGVTYQTPKETLARISTMLREIVEAQDRVRFDRAHFQSYGDSSLVFEIVYYVLDPDYNVYMDIQEAINLGIFARFEEEGIDFAYPTRTLFMHREESEAAPGVDM